MSQNFVWKIHRYEFLSLWLQSWLLFWEIGQSFVKLCFYFSPWNPIAKILWSS